MTTGRLFAQTTLAAIITVASLSITIAGEEKPVAVGDLPEAVTAAIQKALPQGVIRRAASEKEWGRLVYEVKVRSEGTTYQVEVRPDGRVV